MNFSWYSISQCYLLLLLLNCLPCRCYYCISGHTIILSDVFHPCLDIRGLGYWRLERENVVNCSAWQSDQGKPVQEKQVPAAHWAESGEAFSESYSRRKAITGACLGKALTSGGNQHAWLPADRHMTQERAVWEILLFPRLSRTGEEDATWNQILSLYFLGLETFKGRRVTSGFMPLHFRIYFNCTILYTCRKYMRTSWPWVWALRTGCLDPSPCHRVLE